jgi:alkanesulfonate monooxygenase SsuD/methylene tetrahydromethanopterin reductase-like flavin-dependent oxidoreductase (luciferase family)
VANQSHDDDGQGLAPLVEDMSIYVLSGRVSTREAPGVTPVDRGVGDAVEAERLGFRRVFLSERFDLKDAGVQLSAMAGQTTRLEVGTGCMTPASRHPIVAAAFGATMHAVHGPRFVMGIGRGMDFWGMPELKMRQVTEYVTMLNDFGRERNSSIRPPAVQVHPPTSSYWTDWVTSRPPRSGTSPSVDQWRPKLWRIPFTTG